MFHPESISNERRRVRPTPRTVTCAACAAIAVVVLAMLAVSSRVSANPEAVAAALPGSEARPASKPVALQQLPGTPRPRHGASPVLPSAHPDPSPPAGADEEVAPVPDATLDIVLTAPGPVPDAHVHVHEVTGDGELSVHTSLLRDVLGAGAGRIVVPRVSPATYRVSVRGRLDRRIVLAEERVAATAGETCRVELDLQSAEWTRQRCRVELLLSDALELVETQLGVPLQVQILPADKRAVRNGGTPTRAKDVVDLAAEDRSRTRWSLQVLEGLPPGRWDVALRPFGRVHSFQIDGGGPVDAAVRLPRLAESIVELAVPPGIDTSLARWSGKVEGDGIRFGARVLESVGGRVRFVCPPGRLTLTVVVPELGSSSREFLVQPGINRLAFAVERRAAVRVELLRDGAPRSLPLDWWTRLRVDRGVGAERFDSVDFPGIGSDGRSTSARFWLADSGSATLLVPELEGRVFEPERVDWVQGGVTAVRLVVY